MDITGRAIISAILLLLSFQAVAGEISETVHLDPAAVSSSSSLGWTVLNYPGSEQRGAPGHPLLPAVPAVFVLPPGAEDVTVSARPLARIPLASARIRPATMLRPFGSTDPAMLLPDPSVYSSDVQYPDDPLLSSHVGHISGVPVVSCLLQPWEYTPSSGSLEMITSMELTVSWSDGAAFSPSPLQRQVAGARISALTEDGGNREMDLTLQGGDSQYLIVCDSSHTDIFQPLAVYHEIRGLTVETAAIQDILASTPGTDDADILRNFIRDRFLNHGTVFVLLAGDESLIPVRNVYTYCEGYEDVSPADLYFADLDGTWDGNGDGDYGQPNDNLDLYADVILARGLFRTAEDAETFVNKSLHYQINPPSGDWRRRAVLCGAVLFEDEGYTADRGCDSIAVRMPSTWQISKFYEELPGGGFTAQIPLIDEGTAWNHYAGHGNDRGVWWHMAPLAMMTSWIASDTLTNGNRAGIHTSIACHPAQYIDHDCLAEALLQNPDGGGAAVLFNTSYGWEGHWPSLGASEMMCIDLADQVFTHQVSSLGLAFTMARDLRIPYLEGGYDRTFQSLLSFSAFMDPALEVMETADVHVMPPLEFTMSPPAPNPSIGGEAVSVFVAFDEGSAELSIHDMSGRLISRQLLTSPSTVVWNCCNGDGERVPAGVYIISARRGDYIQSRLTTVLP